MDSRERKGAVFDRRISFQHYTKNQEKPPEEFVKRLSSVKLEELEKEKMEIIEKKSDLPQPPKFSGDTKNYKNKSDKTVINKC